MPSEEPKKNLLLQSFGDSINVAVIGANGGIGQALVEQLSLSHCENKVFLIFSKDIYHQPANENGIYIDLEGENTIADAASAIVRLVVRIVANQKKESSNTICPKA